MKTSSFKVVFKLDPNYKISNITILFVFAIVRLPLNYEASKYL